MIDVAAYALLKRGITTSGATTNQITSAEMRDGHLILILSNGEELDCGILPTAEIKDDSISENTTWSSAQIAEYHNENLPSILNGGSAKTE